MSFQWLNMRIQEEKERRQRETNIVERLPRALEELFNSVMLCVEDYNRAFGSEAADAVLLPSKIKVSVREPRDGKWVVASKVEVLSIVALPGFQIDRGETSLAIEVGLLPEDKLFYRDREHDKYLSMEDLTRRVLDRAFFPKLQE
jgi:hypothetical protein